MIAVDTNILVRYLVDDDRIQADKAARLLNGTVRVFIPKTVLLETEWVLRAVYRATPAEINAALSGVAGLRHIVVEDLEQVLSALEMHASGMDFADAVHLTSSEHVERFYSFDEPFVKLGTSFGRLVTLPE